MVKLFNRIPNLEIKVLAVDTFDKKPNQDKRLAIYEKYKLVCLQDKFLSMILVVRKKGNCVTIWRIMCPVMT